MPNPEQKAVSEVAQYYDQEVEDPHIIGVGLINYLGQDYLSPSYSNEDGIALDVSEWKRGAQERVFKMTDSMGIGPGNSVLDIGSGVGGPGRDLMRRYNCNVVGLNVSLEQSKAHRQLSLHTDPRSRYLDIALGDAQHIPFDAASFDHAVAINMLYHVPNPAFAIEEAARILKPGGNIGLDDWFITSEATERNINRLRYMWSAPSTGFHEIDNVKRLLTGARMHITSESDYTHEAGQFLSEERFGSVYDA